MKEILRKAKEQLQSGDIKTISENSGIGYQTIYHALNGKTSKKQTEIIKAVCDFLQNRKTEIEKLEAVLN